MEEKKIEDKITSLGVMKEVWTYDGRPFATRNKVNDTPKKQTFSLTKRVPKMALGHAHVTRGPGFRGV